MKRLAKSTFKALQVIRYNRFHRREAHKVLRNISATSHISASDKRLCREYAIDVLGGSEFAPWLYVYTAISGSFKEGWIPDNYYGLRVIPHYKGDYGKLSDLRSLNNILFQSTLFPDLMSYTNGIFLDTKYRVVACDEVVNSLFAHNKKVFYKKDSSGRGLGVFIFDKESFSLSKVFSLGNGLFQSFIQQHSEIEKFYKLAVATLRITTVIDDQGKSSVRAAYLRLGNCGDRSAKAATNIRVAVDLNSGELCDIGYTPDWTRILVHPASNMKFSGEVFPMFNDCVESVKSLHLHVPFVRCVGWDVTVDQNNKVKIMEWNGEHNDIKFSEATQGPCFSDLGLEQFANK